MIIVYNLIALAIIIFFYRSTIPEIDKRRKILLVILRLLAIVSILILFFNPILYFSRSFIRKPEIIVLNDVSDSMKSKEELFKPMREEVLSKIQNYKIIPFDFADGLSENRSSTNLSKTFSEIQQSLKYIKAFVLFSDGWFKDDKLNFNKNLPIYSFAPDIKVKSFQPQITKIHHNNTIYQDEIAPLSVNVYANNFTGKAALNLFIKNEKITSKNIDFSVENFHQVEFEHIFKDAGLVQFHVDIQPIGKEVVDKRSSAIRVLKERTNILIVSDNLNWDVKYLLRSVSSNSRWNAEFLIKDRMYYKGRKKAFFKNEMQDISILVIVSSSNLNIDKKDYEIIERFIQNGGGLFAFGKPVYNLQNLMPIQKEYIVSEFPCTMHFTEQSKQYQTFDFETLEIEKDIPPVDYYFVNPKVQSTILARFDNEEQSAAMLFDNYSNGKVLYFPFLNLWKWQLRADSDQYTYFISDIIYWLSSDNSKRFIAETNKNSYLKGEKISFELKAFDEKLFPQLNLEPKLEIMSSDKKKVVEKYMTANDDKYISEVTELPEGTWEFEISAWDYCLK